MQHHVTSQGRLRFAMRMMLPFRCLVVIFLLTVGCLAETLSSGEDVAKFVQEKIEQNEVVVFAKSYCPYCKMTRSLLEQEEGQTGIQYEMVYLDFMDAEDGPLTQMELLKKTGQRTVPNIFIAGQHIEGGNEGIQNLARAGTLRRMLLDVIDDRA